MKKISLFIIMLIGSILLVGCQTSETDEYYTVVFYTNTGTTTTTETTPIYNIESQIETIKVNEGDKIEKPQDPEKDYSIFLGWYKDNLLTEVWDFDNDTIEKSMTLYAKWDFATFNITYDLMGGSIADTGLKTLPTVYTINSTELFISSLSLYNLPISDSGKRFRGWYLDSDLTIKVESIIPGEQIDGADDGVLFVGDITLYAKYFNF